MYYIMTTNIRYNIKFSIFSGNKGQTKEQIKIIIAKLTDESNFDNDLKKILKRSIAGLTDYKFLDRYEPAISSFDERKQIRLTWRGPNKYEHSLHFNQLHSQSKEYFSIDELKTITNRIKTELEEYLMFEIDTPILYVAVDEL